MNKFGQKLDGYFKVSERGSTFGTEIIAGITTFLAMAYILTVNPTYITRGTPYEHLWDSVFLATVFGAVIGTLLMGVYAKLPYAQAPGMGLNSQLNLMLLGFATGYAYSFGAAMVVILLSGIIFLLLSIIPCGKDKETGRLIAVREKLFDGIPQAIRTAIPVGIGLFIALLGFINSGIVQLSPYTGVDMVVFSTLFSGAAAAKSAIVCVCGLIIVAVLSKLKVKGAVLIGILAAAVISIPFGMIDYKVLTTASEWKFWEKFANFFKDTSEGGTFFSFDFKGAFASKEIGSTIMLIVTFCMVDMFDTVGTLMGCASRANLLDKDNKPIGFSRAMIADSVATVAGGFLGTSTVTTFVESGAGVGAGGRTGFSSVITALMFIISIFVLPVFKVIPSAAAAVGLIYVGVLMMGNVVKIDFKDIRNALPAFITIAGMPFFYSITDGIGLGLITYVLINILCYLGELIVYAVKKGRAPATSTASASETVAEETVAEDDVAKDEVADETVAEDVAKDEVADETATQEVAETEQAEELAKPKWPISIVTGVVAVLFLVLFLVPLS